MDYTGEGKVAQYPMLSLHFSDPDGPKWRGRKYPKHVDVTPFDRPGWDQPDTRAFKNFADYKAYVTGLWASGKGRTGWYSRNLTDLRDSIFNWDVDASPAVTQLAFPTISMVFTDVSLAVDAQAGAWRPSRVGDRQACGRAAAFVAGDDVEMDVGVYHHQHQIVDLVIAHRLGQRGLDRGGDGLEFGMRCRGQVAECRGVASRGKHQ